MEKNLVGYRFSPTGEELIDYYLKNKILDELWLVNEAINEINICAHDPESLPSLSKLKSNDLEWYFFSLREYYAPEKKKGTKRRTRSGFWKVTGPDTEIRDKRGHGEVIGSKKTLVYRQGRSANGVKTPWVMHEYHITSLPLNQSNYVICKVMYKGVDGDSLFGNNANELNHSMVSVSNTTPEVEQPGGENLFMSMDDLPTPMNEQDDLTLFNSDTFLNQINPHQLPQIHSDDEYIGQCLTFNDGNFNSMLGDLGSIMLIEHRNDHRPMKPLTGFLSDYSSDSDDAESISATSYQALSSPDSAHYLSRPFHKEVLSSSNGEDEILSLRKDSCIDAQPPAETSIYRNTRKSHLTRRTIPSKQEVNEGKFKAVDASMEKKSSSSSPMVKTEKKGCFITDEAMDRRNGKNPRYIYLMNMIISFIILVAVTPTGNITSVSLSVKT